MMDGRRTALLFGCLMVILSTTAEAGSFRPPKDYFYFTPEGIGTRWTCYTYDVADPNDHRWTFTEVVDTVTLGVTGETLSYRVETSESFDIGDPNPHVYKIFYYTFNESGDLCISGGVGESLIKIDPVYVYLRNPVTVGDSTYSGFGETPYTLSAVVVSDTDTLQLPSGKFRNCLHIRERSWFNGVPAEVTDTWYIPVPWPYAGRGKEKILHWNSYPTSSRTSLSYLVNCVPVGIEEVTETIPPTPRLDQNHPNPFNPSTTISFTLPERVRVTLSIYDVKGRLLTTVVDETVGEGYQERIWDGKDAGGSPVGSGVYFYRLTAGDKTLTKKMVLLK